MLGLQIKTGEGITLTHRVTGEQIRFEAARVGERTMRAGIFADDIWQILRDSINPDYMPSIQERGQIQTGRGDVADLGRKG